MPSCRSLIKNLAWKKNTVDLGIVEKAETEAVKRLIRDYEHNQPPIVAENRRQWQAIKRKVAARFPALQEKFSRNI